jgi:uncharacterized membrane protein YdjX (TVP38/TMEM64 family)
VLTTPTPPDPAAVRVRRRAAWLRLGVLLVLVVVAGSLVLLTDGLSIAALREQVARWGPVAPVLFALLYALATVLLLPGTPLTLAAGVLFGPLVGAVTALIGATLGATGAFLLGRAVGRRAVEELAGERVQAVDRHLGERGFVSVLVVRLIPLFPFNVVNLVAGITAVRLPTYVAATAIGIVPGVAILASTGGALDDPTSPRFLASLGAYLAVLVGSSVVARRVRARRAEAEVTRG